MRGLAGMMNALAQTGQGALEGYQLGRQWKEEDRLRQQQEADRARQIAQQNRQTAIQDLEIGLKFGDQARASEAAERAGLGGLNLDDHFRKQKQAEWSATMAEIDKLPMTKDQKFAEMKRRHPDWEPLTTPVTKDVMIPGYANVQERVPIKQAPGISDELPGRPQGPTQYATQTVRKPIMETVEQAKPQGLIGPMPAESRHKQFPAKKTTNEAIVPFTDYKAPLQQVEGGKYTIIDGKPVWLPDEDERFKIGAENTRKAAELGIQVQMNNADNATSRANAQTSAGASLGVAGINAQNDLDVAKMNNERHMAVARLKAENNIAVASLRGALQRARDAAKATGKPISRMEFERFRLSANKTLENISGEIATLQDPMNLIPEPSKQQRLGELIQMQTVVQGELNALTQDFTAQGGLSTGPAPAKTTTTGQKTPVPAATPNPAVDLILQGVEKALK